MGGQRKLALEWRCCACRSMLSGPDDLCPNCWPDGMPARTYTLTAERLEAMLRECWEACEDHIEAVRTDYTTGYKTPSVEEHIASALAEIERGQA